MSLKSIKTITIEVKSETHETIGQPPKGAFGPLKYDFNFQTYRSKIQNPSGRLSIIVDEITRNYVSYFIREKVGVFKKKSYPLLFKDERLEHLSNVLVTGVNSSLFYTGRRLLIVFDNSIQSKWLKPSLENLLQSLKVNRWREGVYGKKEYDGLAVNIELHSGLLSKGIEIGWFKRIYRNGWDAKIYHPTFITPQKKVKIEDFFELVYKKAKKAIETDVLELIALEDFCLTSPLEIYKIGLRESGAKKLDKGRLNFNKVKVS